ATNHPHPEATFTASSDVVGRDISLDQLVANEIHGGTFRKSLTLGVWGRSGNLSKSVSYAAKGQPIPVTVDPGAVFKDLFGNVPAPTDGVPSGIDLATARRKSVLDFVKRDFDALTPRLSGEDRKRLDTHADMI